MDAREPATRRRLDTTPKPLGAAPKQPAATGTGTGFA
jgi:hypothetical protein